MVYLPTRILPKSIFDRSRWAMPIYEAGRRARLALGSTLGARYVDGLGSKAHFNDVLLAPAGRDQVESYRRGGVAFVDLLERSLREAGRGWKDVRACLEVGCGYGRIVRELRRQLPARTISVCDLNEEAARFTAAEFGVRKVPIIELMGPVRNGAFDLVYVPALYTRLDRAMIEMNLAKVSALTRPGGIVVFATLGRQSAGMAERYDQYWLDKRKLHADLDRSGFVHERHAFYQAEYGLTWITPDEVKNLVADTASDLDFIAHHPAAVDDHLDVFVYLKV